MNRVIITGRLTKDPELYTNEAGTSRCRFNLAVPRIGAKEGLQQTDFFNCVAWNKQAENLCQYQKKGSLIAIEGELRADIVEDEDSGTKVYYSVFANRIEYLESKGNKEETKGETKKESDPFTDFSNEVELKDEDLPF